MDHNSEAEINALQISEQNKQIVELINLGLEKEEIAKRVGISMPVLHTRIAQLRKEHILPFDTSGQDHITIKEQELLDLFSEGLDIDHIAELMGISQSSIRVYMQRLRQKGYLPITIYIKIQSELQLQIKKVVNEFLKLNSGYFVNQISGKPKTRITVDISTFKEIIRMLGYRQQDVRLLLRLYGERKSYEEALMLLQEYESHNELPQSEILQLKALKNVLRKQFLRSLTGSVPDYFNTSDSLTLNER